MRPVEYEIIVGTLFSLRGWPITKTWILHDVEGFLTFDAAKKDTIAKKVFLQITEHLLKKGLTAQQWTDLGCSLNKFYKGKLPCLNPQLP